jgi:O-antigen ligase
MAARNANRLAFLCDLVIAIIACAMVRLNWRWLRVAGSIVIALLVVTVFLSASRSGLINLLLMAVYFISRAGVPMKRFVMGTLFAGVLVLLVLQLVPGQYIPFVPSSEDVVRRAVTTAARQHNIPSAYLDRITSFVMSSGGQAGVEASTENRLELALTGLRMFVDHPLFGVGVGNFRWKSIIEYNNPHVSALHNSYILTLTEGGLIIFLAYLALFVIVFKVLGEARRRAAERPELGLGWLVEATQIMFVMFLIFSAFADCWHEAYLVFLGALTTVLARVYATTAPPASPVPAERSATA